jgi:hypothetical protein
MPSVPRPLRALRSPRWRAPLVAGAVLAGVIAAPLAASPAEAHGNGKHYVTISGWVRTHTGFEDCADTYNQTITLQRGKTEERTIDINRYCGDHTAGLRLLARLRDDKYVYTEGFIRVHARSCLILEPLCVWENKRKDYRADIPEDFTQDMPHPETLKVQTMTDVVTMTWDFDIIVDGPDAP